MTAQDPTQLNPLPTYKELKQAIPKKCFERSTIRSMIYPIRDSLLLILVGYAAVKLINFQLTILNIVLWLIYAYVQGTISFGLFIVGHQCGHGAFSQSVAINDIVGYITHTFLLVPYFSWQRSHFVHHSKNNHLLDNQSHVPSYIQKSKQLYKTIYKIFGHYGFIIFKMMLRSAVGWIIYLFFHGEGSRRNPYTKQQYKSTPNHFSPFASNQLFAKQMKFKVFLSTLGVILMISGLIYLGFIYGFKEVFVLYVGPYNVTFAWLAILTWLQHTQSSVPHYGQDKWTWLKGAVLTVDRNYPWIIDHLHHRIGTTHVLHHIFPEIPHYHAVQATKAIIPLLGKNYRYDPMPITKAIWKIASQCHFVSSLEGVQYYKSFLKNKSTQKGK